MAITDWPEGERPRERLLRQGAESLSDAELLAIFLRTGVKGKSAVDLARDLITKFGGIRPILEADQNQFCDTSGLGEAKFAQLQAVLELAARHLQEHLHREQEELITSAQTTRDFLTTKLRGHPHEVFAALFLDNQHRIITFEVLATGTIDGASIHPREVVRKAMSHNAAAMIFAHNHPSGIAEPSRADRDITNQLRETLAMINIRVLDHIIIGDGQETTSFAERGLL